MKTKDLRTLIRARILKYIENHIPNILENHGISPGNTSRLLAKEITQELGRVDIIPLDVISTRTQKAALSFFTEIELEDPNTEATMLTSDIKSHLANSG